MTIQEAIAAQFATLLAGIPGATIERSREAAVARSEGTVVIVRPEQATAEFRSKTVGLLVWDLVIRVTVIARGATPDQVADPVIEAIHARVMADLTLGGRCAEIVPLSTSYDYEIADLTAVAVDQRFRARVLTNAASVSAPA